jgi:hypothetical protein
MAAPLQHRKAAQLVGVPSTSPRNGDIAMVALRFRYAPPAASHGAGGNDALTINADHSVGAGQGYLERRLFNLNRRSILHRRKIRFRTVQSKKASADEYTCLVGLASRPITLGWPRLTLGCAACASRITNWRSVHSPSRYLCRYRQNF